MPYGLAIQRQDSFGGGIFRGRNAPRDSVYDAVNALVGDEDELFERGGSTYLTGSNLPSAVRGLVDINTVAGARTLAWTAADQLFLVHSGVPVDMNLGLPFQFRAWRRVATIGPETVFLVTEGGDDWLIYYAGSNRPYNDADGSSGNVTKGSRNVTGVGTNWLATVDPGTYVQGAGGTSIVESIQSNTQMTLRDPWQGTSSVGAGLSLRSLSLAPLASRLDPAAAGEEDLAGSSCIGSSPQRLFIGNGNRVHFSRPYYSGYILGFGFHSPSGLTTPPYSLDGGAHELPEGASVVGLQAIGGAEMAFTTEGVWALLNTDLDPIDAFGNVQHQVAALTRDVILWSEPGIVPWAGGLLVPALDDLFLMGQDGAVAPLSGPIRRLYRAYVKAGLSAGMASVHRGHYFLPIIDGADALIDVLVCRLDLRDSRGATRPAWTRWGGHAAGAAYAQRVGATTRQPRLFGVNGQRVTEVSDCFNVPGTGADADGSIPTFEVITNDVPAGGGARGATCRKLRLRYELAGDPSSVSAAVSRGAEGAAFEALAVPGDAGVSDGTKPATWLVNRRAPALRFRIRSTSANTKLILRGFELHMRPTGKA